eukprot:RCo039777
MGTFPSLPSALRWRSSPTPTDAAEPRSAGESSTAAATGPTSTRRGRAADPTAPSPAMFYPQLQAKLVAMEKQGLYPGWKYREEALTREVVPQSPPCSPRSPSHSLPLNALLPPFLSSFSLSLSLSHITPRLNLNLRPSASIIPSSQTSKPRT